MKIVTHGEPWKTGTRRSPGAAEAVRDAHLLGDLLEGHARAPHARHDLVEAARVPLALYLLDDGRRRRRPALEDRELLPGLGAATRLHHGFGSRVASVGTYSETTAVLRPSRSFHKPRSSSASSTPIAPTSPCSSTAPPRGPAWSAKSEKKWGV